jgi:hypothetical protein
MTKIQAMLQNTVTSSTALPLPLPAFSSRYVFFFFMLRPVSLAQQTTPPPAPPFLVGFTDDIWPLFQPLGSISFPPSQSQIPMFNATQTYNAFLQPIVNCTGTTHLVVPRSPDTSPLVIMVSIKFVSEALAMHHCLASLLVK